MIFKGIQFTRAPKIVTLPQEMFRDTDTPSYVRFGRWVKEGTKGAVKTNWTYMDRFSETKRTVWAVPIEIEGWSRTNMAYGSDGRLYLALGSCYSAPRYHRHHRFKASDMAFFLGRKYKDWKVEYAYRRNPFIHEELTEKAKDAIEARLRDLFPGAKVKVHGARSRRVERPDGVKEYAPTKFMKQVIDDLITGRGERLLDT